MELFAATRPRDVCEAFLQGQFLERNQLQLPPAIPPVDPPGEALSKPSFAVVDDRGFIRLHLYHSVSCPARSLSSCPLADSEHLLESAPVETDNHLPVDERDRGRPDSQFQEFLQRLLIFPDILCDELHTLLRKKLFLLVAGSSPGLGVHDYLFRHGFPPILYLPFDPRGIAAEEKADSPVRPDRRPSLLAS